MKQLRTVQLHPTITFTRLFLTMVVFFSVLSLSASILLSFMTNNQEGYTSFSALVDTNSASAKNELKIGSNLPFESCRSLLNFKEKLLCVVQIIKEGREDDDSYPLYSVSLLDSLPGDGKCSVYAVNEKNQATGWCMNTQGHVRAVIWDDGRVKNLGLPRNELALGTIGYSINEQGDVVGHSQKRTEPILHAMTYIKGTMKAFRPFTFVEGDSVARDINEHNQIVGGGLLKIVDVEDLDEGFDEKKNIQHAFFFDNSSLGRGVVQDLGASDEMTSSYAYDLNNRGQIVGFTEVNIDDIYVRRATFWTENNHEMVIFDRREAISAMSEAFAINELNPPQVVGSMLVNQGGPYVSHGFLWQGDQMIDLETYGQCLISFANDISNNGLIVGIAYGYPCGEVPEEYKAVLWILNQNDFLVTDLNQLIQDDDWRLSVPVAVNDAHVIVGNGYYQGQLRPFMLIPNNQNQ
ncbi:MAG: hypothetical protein A3B74_00575 [Candidatus Kerfeldbacteria bacterium RIFCSPHIGHO2_02_FULL_42_14]|uniref:Uncharacterized protein n=1 Tax=Candidatus Kerfeldbacteria bacterium RIFCSPHIGHO2_02_FULL_42_14 TaxID=1798540 RepID=A0A1G2ATL5_9BACT|nr:MAG: hypothetical protein A3B74_00575 [Candidatus Kerfeldbacteria bacterium RIFCSPHIGHO2_02_FULL_42_14]OGY81464.1 MAG: hypothetical protein A3E60_05570 [Candidatus Kerfeldbacteria bacterium RIFCSPHIGHO2_12_FULL_42_13]OGY83511.1 MAG: hypothetical protein A3I91_02600 [Candidatus Kerfeldbacteria bacterium RIFCSPLOWO2_02_FULL_42_19]OGY86962.1 MAG: hypothetical protein A3G01_01605 [Candidatus Kerfeldbacteria bacterium RIFCSPLOWO2_12_FULL_43_9]